MALLAGISNPETFKLALQWSWDWRNIINKNLLCGKCDSAQRNRRLTTQQRRTPCTGSGVSSRGGFQCAFSPHCTCST